jgi:nicotinamide mononucleotide transporter
MSRIRNSGSLYKILQYRISLIAHRSSLVTSSSLLAPRSLLLLWLPFSLTEALGFVTGAACVYLVVRRSIWNFPLGIANNLFFFVLFIDSRLFGDAWLQVVYLALGVQGWYNWLYGGEGRTKLRITHASTELLLGVAGAVIIGTGLLFFALRSAGGLNPLLDALTTVMSLAAQYLLNRKVIENWAIWIAADVIYIYLYIARGLHLTAVLYFIFLCLCVAGWRSWRQHLNKDPVVAPRTEGSTG